MNVSIRMAEENDASLLFKLAKECEPGIKANNQMVYYLASTVMNKYVFIAELENKPVGFIFGILDSFKNSIWIHQLAVLEETRRKGIGQMLLMFFEAEAVKENISTAELMVKPKNFARNLYNKNEYKEIEVNEDLNMILCSKSL